MSKLAFFVCAALLFSAVAFAAEVEVKSEVAISTEISSTIESMVHVEDSHAIVQSLQAEAMAVRSAHGVERLIKLINKVLQRLLRSMKRRALRNKRQMKGCKMTISRDKAIIAKARQMLKTAKVRIAIAKNKVETSKHESSRLQRKAADHSQAAARIDAQIRAGKEELKVKIARLQADTTETEALIKLLKAVNAKLTANGLAEVESELSQAAAAHARAEVSAMLELAAGKARAGDVQDVHDMIDLLIKQLEQQVKANGEEIVAARKVWRQSKKALIGQADSERANAKTAVEQRDGAIKAGDKAAALILTLESKIAALKKNIKATRAHLKATKSRCRHERRVFRLKKKSARKQIRVLRQVIAMLRNQKLSQQMVGMLKDVKLNLPIWKKGAWSQCSKSCGVGKQTRSVSCSAAEGAKCLGNKPRTSRMCNLGACKADCIVSQWSAWSACSSKCGGGVKTRTRKVLALAVNGGKACPSAAGLEQKMMCNSFQCGSRKQAAVQAARKEVAAAASKARSAQRAVARNAAVAKKSVARKGKGLLKRAARKGKNIARRVGRNGKKVARRVGRKGKNLARRGRRAVKKGKRVARRVGRKGKKGLKRAARKGRKMSKRARRALRKKLVKKLKAVARKARKLAKTAKKTDRKLAGIKKALKQVKTKAQFLQLVSRAKKTAAVAKAVEKKLAKANVQKFTLKQKAWTLSKKGVAAAKFCAGKAAKGSNAFKGCMQDMRMTKGDTKMAGKAAVQTRKVIAIAKKAAVKARVALRTGGNAPSRTCTAVGDPHQTSFQGDYFHLQVNGIYTYARSDDGFFEVQAKQWGSRGAGSPSVIQNCMIRYDGQVYSNVLNKDGFRVNCQGSQMTITVPGAYQDHMEGICGANSISRGAHNFALPGGARADVSYGKRLWEAGGYGGAGSKLSKWSLAWRPSVEQCMYPRAECVQNARPMNARAGVVNTPWGRIDFARL